MKKYYEEFVNKNLYGGDKLMLDLKSGHFYIFIANVGTNIEFKDEYIIFTENNRKTLIDYVEIEKISILT